MNSNGVLSFGNIGFTDFRARPFPFVSPPLIAPFWDDFDPSNGGRIFYRQTSDSDQLQLFSNYTLLLKDDEAEDFCPTHLFIATWERVPPFGYIPHFSIPFEIGEVYILKHWLHILHNTNLSTIYQNQHENTFQVVLATNGTITLTAFLYSDIQWERRAQIGFNAGDGYSFFMLNEALTDETVTIDERSNVERPGIFVFRIDGIT